MQRCYANAQIEQLSPEQQDAKFDKTELDYGVSRLRKDLEMGAWNQMYGYLRQQQQYDAGYRFVHTATELALGADA